MNQTIPETTAKAPKIPETPPNVPETIQDAAIHQARGNTGNGMQRGMVKKVDAANDSLTLDVDGQELAVRVVPRTRVIDALGKDMEKPNGVTAFNVGDRVAFKVDGGVLVRLRLFGDGQRGRQPGQLRLGTIASIDLDKLTIVFKTTEKAVEAVANERTRFFPVSGRDFKEQMQTLKVGADVRFMVQPKDGKNYLVGVQTLPSAR
jgi:Cu/Ag efflux protein CusF